MPKGQSIPSIIFDYLLIFTNSVLGRKEYEIHNDLRRYVFMDEEGREDYLRENYYSKNIFLSSRKDRRNKKYHGSYLKLLNYMDTDCVKELDDYDNEYEGKTEYTTYLLVCTRYTVYLDIVMSYSCLYLTMGEIDFLKIALSVLYKKMQIEQERNPDKYKKDFIEINQAYCIGTSRTMKTLRFIRRMFIKTGLKFRYSHKWLKSKR